MIFSEVWSAEWWTTLISLITGLVGLISAGVALFFSIKSKVSEMKTQSSATTWATIISAADSAMKSVEASGLSGADKKTMVIDAVKAALSSLNIDGSAFMDQLSSYIDNSIDFVNSMTTASTTTTTTTTTTTK